MANRKRLFGIGLLAAGVLTAVTAGLFAPQGHHTTPVNLTGEFSDSSSGTTAVKPALTRAGWDYTGADDPQAFKDYIKTLSRDRALFVMLHDPDCSHCQDLSERLHQIQDQHLTRLDYDVLRVDINRYSRVVWDMKAGNSIPECHVYCGDAEPIVFAGDMRDIPSAVDFMEGVFAAHAGNLPVAPGFKGPR